jgi:hypothetical protein
MRGTIKESKLNINYKSTLQLKQLKTSNNNLFFIDKIYFNLKLQI